MAIQAQDILTSKARKFGASEESVQFQQIVLEAINFSLDDLENLSGVPTSQIDTIAEEIDIDKQRYHATVTLGVDVYMQDLSQYSIQSSEGLWERYKFKLKTAHMRRLQDTTNVSVYGKFGDLS